jgi:hypothetical protein
MMAVMAAALLALAAWEVPQIWRGGDRRTLWVFGALFVFLSAFCVLFVLDIHWPGPAELLFRTFKELFHLSYAEF